MAFDETASIDRDIDGADRAYRPARSGNRKADSVWSAVSRAEGLVRFVIEQPMPGVRVVRVAGELDLLTAPLLDYRLRSHINEGPVHLVVDLSEVTFLGVAGLGSLVTARETATERDIELHLTGADHRAVGRVLEVVGLRTTFDIHPTVHSVVDAIRDRAFPDRIPPLPRHRAWNGPAGP